MDVLEEVTNSFKKLEEYVSNENYCGWDPYDALYTKRIPKRLLNNKFLGIVLIQLNKYSPINFRRILIIKKGRSNKALALFSRAYYLASLTLENQNYYREKAFYLLRELIAKTDENCASHYFNYVSLNSSLNPSTTDIICLLESIKSLIIAYNFEKKIEFLEKANYRLEKIFNLLLITDKEIAYVKYTPVERGKVVFNVSSLFLEALSEFGKFKKMPEYYIEISEKIVRFLLKHQRDDGAWPYSIYTEKGKYYWQIDFHQGFIIDGLNSILPYLDGKVRTETENALNKAIRFYMEKQFTKDGYSYYRYPFKYPIDIHNQAQGIITFSKLYKTRGEEKYLDFAKKIALWTIKNMQSPEGYFYAHKWPFFVNKIPYMRWGQAWMMLALATLLEVLRE
ncbi:MAG: hypothetical protein QW532_01080 [Archaeoglobaceae archaeon]